MTSIVVVNNINNMYICACAFALPPPSHTQFGFSHLSWTMQENSEKQPQVVTLVPLHLLMLAL